MSTDFVILKRLRAEFGNATHAMIDLQIVLILPQTTSLQQAIIPLILRQ